MKLPLNCSVDYLSDFLNPEEAADLYQLLIEEYEIEKARLMIEAGGKLHQTDSFKIIFSTPELIDQNAYPESIHGKCHPWSGTMASLRIRVEQLLNHKFEVAMCLFYPNGQFFAPYHFDQTTSGSKTILPSISLGAPRTFEFRENVSGDVYSLELDNGSLLTMGDHCQDRYEHSLPKDAGCTDGRINITFREPAFR